MAAARGDSTQREKMQHGARAKKMRTRPVDSLPSLCSICFVPSSSRNVFRPPSSPVCQLCRAFASCWPLCTEAAANNVQQSEGSVADSTALYANTLSCHRRRHVDVCTPCICQFAPKHVLPLQEEEFWSQRLAALQSKGRPSSASLGR